MKEWTVECTANCGVTYDSFVVKADDYTHAVMEAWAKVPETTAITSVREKEG